MKPVSKNDNGSPENGRKYYSKTHATGGYCGNEYEIKLSGLIWLNLKYDEDVKDFLLGTNVVAARPLDDICVKIVWKDEKRKPTVIVIQLKHKINENNTAIKLDEIFSAYKKIKKLMNEEEDDGLFEARFDELECYSILYTNENFTLKTDVVTDNNYWHKLNDIIGTHGSIRKLSEKGKEKYIKNMRENNEDCSENEFNAFVNSLLVFSKQASEMGVEEILKEHIDQHPRAFKNPFPLEPHPVTLTYIRMFVDWWKEVKRPYYFTKKDDLLDNAFKAIIKSPWMSSLNIIYKSKISDRYEFTDDAVSSLNLQDQHSSTVITTEHSVLTVVKVLQHLDNKDHVVLDLEYIASLQHGNRKALCEELKTKEDYVVILVCDKIPKNETFNDIGEVTKNKIRILISNNNKSSQKLKEYFPVAEGKEHRKVHDSKNRLTDISAESKLNILETATVMFQNKEVKLTAIVDDKSQKYVKGDVLHEIVCGNTIAIGKLIVKSNYDDIKHFWIDRRVNFSNRKVPLNTLNDIEDGVVLVTAEPGMGKSTLLTHLSIKTKELKPEVWVVRINLLEYSAEFRNWKKDKTDLLETIKFMCQVILRDKLGKGSNVTFTLEEKDNVVYLKKCTADPMTEFELNLFLHFYYEKEIIFLFDGFDEISSHYKDVVIKCLKTVSNDLRKHRIWITSRSYNKVKTELEEEFGLSYEIDNFSYKEVEEYLQTFWECNLRLEELDSVQLDNVWKLLWHVSSVIGGYIAEPVDWTLYQVMRNAALYASYKIKNTHIPLWEYNTDVHEDIFYEMCNNELCDCCQCCYCVATCCHPDTDAVDDSSSSDTRCEVNPLIMYLAAVDVVYNIKKHNKMSDEWYLDADTYTVYENFLKNLIKRRYQGKHELKTCNSDIIELYEEVLASYILNHKKLAVYAIFNEYSSSFFSNRDLKNIKNMIKLVETGKLKTDLIESVANGIPIFIHRTFAEYLAVEYICDRLKNKKKCVKINDLIVYFDVMFSEAGYFARIRQIFDNKINTDKALVCVLENNKDMIFKWILSIAKTVTRLPFLWIAFENLNSIGSVFDEIINYGKDNTDLTDSEKIKLSKLSTLRRLIRTFLFYYGGCPSDFIETYVSELCLTIN